MDMNPAAAVDLLGNDRSMSSEKRGLNSKESWANSRRSWKFWLLLVIGLVAVPVACVSFVYVFKSVRLPADDKSESQIPDSALNKLFNALQLHSPWHDNAVGANQVCNTSECVHAAYHLLLGINQAANPCEDFYEFACGNWIKLYKDRGCDYNSHFREMRFSEKVLVEGLLMRPLESYDSLPVKTAAIFYHQCVHEDNVDSVVNLTTKLGGWPSLEGENWNEDGFDIVTAVAFAHRQYLLKIFVGIEIAPHRVNNETLNVLKLSVPVFTRNSEINDNVFRTAFKSLNNQTLSELIGRTGWSEQQEQDSNEIIELKKALAKAVTHPDEHANVTNTQATVTVTEFQEYLDKSLNHLNEPLTNYSISWKRLLNEIFSTSEAQINDDQLLIVADLDYFSRMAKILDATPKRIIANYIFWSLTLTLLPESNRKLDLTLDEFFLRSDKLADLSSRKSYCFVRTMRFFNVPIMHEYLKTKSNLEDRAVVERMTANLLFTSYNILENNDWLSDAAKLTAQKKLRALKTFIGYPDWLLNTTEIESRFEGLHAGSSFIDTFGNVGTWTSNKLIRELGKNPSNLEEPWFASRKATIFHDYDRILPSAVQAYHNGYLNSLVVPMGFIQPHHFYNNVPSYVNYGRIGAVIGHEIIHRFHVTTKDLDKNGQSNVQSWTAEDEQNYEEKSNCFRDQYNKFEVFPGIRVNGYRRLNGNIADNGGLKLAYLTYQEKYSRACNDYQSLPGFEKLSAEQLFFLSYGSLWCEHVSMQIQKFLLLVDPRSPGKYRINGVLQNSPEFAAAWNCPVGVRMSPVKKCALW